MKNKLPILIIIPHGGTAVPDELTECAAIDEFGLFIESDTYANELYDFEGDVAEKLDTQISRLFVDLDRSSSMIPERSFDTIIKEESINGRKIFKDNIFPDEIAKSNIIHRYYQPFHESIQRHIKSGRIKIIIECHTMMPVGPRNSKDAGKPRSLINVDHITTLNGKVIRTCPSELAENFLSLFKKNFNNEDNTVAGKFSLNNPRYEGYILSRYGQEKIPMLRLSISTSLFLNDKYFSYDYLTVDSLRIKELRKKIFSSIEKFAVKFF